MGEQVSISEAARRLKVSRLTVRRMMQRLDMAGGSPRTGRGGVRIDFARLRTGRVRRYMKRQTSTYGRRLERAEKTLLAAGIDWAAVFAPLLTVAFQGGDRLNMLARCLRGILAGRIYAAHFLAADDVLPEAIPFALGQVGKVNLSEAAESLAAAMVLYVARFDPPVGISESEIEAMFSNYSRGEEIKREASQQPVSVRYDARTVRETASTFAGAFRALIRTMLPLESVSHSRLRYGGRSGKTVAIIESKDRADARGRRGYSMAQLATMLGVSRPTLYAWRRAAGQRRR